MVSRHSLQYPLEGCKCLGGNLNVFISSILVIFGFFIPLKGGLNGVTGDQEKGTNAFFRGQFSASSRPCR